MTGPVTKTQDSWSLLLRTLWTSQSALTSRLRVASVTREWSTSPTTVTKLRKFLSQDSKALKSLSRNPSNWLLLRFPPTVVTSVALFRSLSVPSNSRETSTSVLTKEICLNLCLRCRSMILTMRTMSFTTQKLAKFCVPSASMRYLWSSRFSLSKSNIRLTRYCLKKCKTALTTC